MIPRCTRKQIRSDCPRSAPKFGKLKKSESRIPLSSCILVQSFIKTKYKQTNKQLYIVI